MFRSLLLFFLDSQVYDSQNDRKKKYENGKQDRRKNERGKAKNQESLENLSKKKKKQQQQKSVSNYFFLFWS